jgi:hypothetical protein
VAAAAQQPTATAAPVDAPLDVPAPRGAAGYAGLIVIGLGLLLALGLIGWRVGGRRRVS